MTAHYSAERIRRGVRDLLGGKVFSSVAGFLSLMLAVRILSIDAFAAYTVALATVELVMAITGLGLVHVALRFIPELITHSKLKSLRSLVVAILGTRSVFLVIAVVITLILFGERAGQIGLLPSSAFLLPFGVLAILRPTSLFLSQILESMLHQGLAQGGLTVASVMRLAGLTILYFSPTPPIEDVLWVEVLSDAAGLLVMGVGTMIVVRRYHRACGNQDDGDWLRTNAKRVARFSASAYLQMLTLLPAGSHTYRVVAGSLLSPQSTAAFGFGVALADYVRRYLPGNLLVGVIRPVILSRYSATGNYVEAVRSANLVCAINWIFLGAGAAVVLVVGGELMAILSSHKYGNESAWVFLAFLVLTGFETVRQQLEILAQAIERYELLIIPNLALSISILLAIQFAPFMGALAFPVSGIVGLLVANRLITSKMAAQDHPYVYDWAGIGRIVGSVAVSAMLGFLALLFGLPWWIAGGMAGATYVCAILLLCKRDLREISMMMRERKPSSSLPNSVERNL